MATKDIPEIRQNAIGFVLTLRTNTPMEDTTALKLIIKNDEERKEKTLTEVNITNTANGEVSYTLEENDLAVPGKYRVQIIDVTDGVFLPSDITEFRVVENL